MNQTDENYETGKKEGISEGMRLGILRAISFILAKRFGDVPEDLSADLAEADLKTLEKTLHQIIELELPTDEKQAGSSL